MFHELKVFRLLQWDSHHNLTQTKKEEAKTPVGFVRQGCTCSVASPSPWSPFKFVPEVSSSQVNSRESVTSPNGLKSINQILPCSGTTEELKQVTELKQTKPEYYCSMSSDKKMLKLKSLGFKHLKYSEIPSITHSFKTQQPVALFFFKQKIRERSNKLNSVLRKVLSGETTV